jgi:predicted alpha/beta-fold hydrolase
MLLNGQLEQSLLDGLVCVSSPLDLGRCSQQFDRPRNRLYRRWVLRRLRQLTLADPKGALAEELSALSGPERVKTLRAFDARITAPRWGYHSVDDYYAAASPLQPLLKAVGTGRAMAPILLIHAADDPWVPVAATRQLAEEAQRRGCPWLETVIPAHGGHNGFHSREHAGRADGGSTTSWADRQTTAWLKGLAQRLG